MVVIRRSETLVDIAKDDEVSTPRPEILHHVLQGVFGQLLEACRISLVTAKRNFLQAGLAWAHDLCANFEPFHVLLSQLPRLNPVNEASLRVKLRLHLIIKVVPEG